VFVEPETIKGIEAVNASYEAGNLKVLEKYHAEKTNGIFRAWSDTWRSPWFRHWNMEYALPSIACPVLVMQGIDDEYGTEAQVESIATKVPNAEKLLLENCGHTPHREQTEAVAHAMQAFIQRCIG
jgi:pimeloyl-ACP methyl ester carboxylesterase